MVQWLCLCLQTWIPDNDYVVGPVLCTTFIMLFVSQGYITLSFRVQFANFFRTQRRSFLLNFCFEGARSGKRHHLLYLSPWHENHKKLKEKKATKVELRRFVDVAVLDLLSVWPDWAIYWTLGSFLKPLATNNLPKSLTFFGNFFVKFVKIFNFSGEIVFGQLLAFFSGHTACCFECSRP